MTGKIKKITSVAGSLASIFFFITGAWILYRALSVFSDASISEWKVTALFTYSLAMFLLAFRGSLSGFSVFGLKAELRDKINEADAVLHALRDLAKVVLKPTLTTVASLGRWGGGFPHRQKYEIRQQAEGVMRSLNIPEQEIQDTLLDLHRYNLYDLMDKAKEPTVTLLREKVKEKQQAHNTRFKGTITEHEEHHRSVEVLRLYRDYESRFVRRISGHDLCFASYKSLLDEIKNCSILTDAEKKTLADETLPALQDLKYYCEHKDFKAPSVLADELPE